MPSFDKYPQNDLIKMLYLGDSSTGKTGSLCSLGAVGYNVRILDLDKGAQIIRGYVTDPKSPYLQAHPPEWTLAQTTEIASRMSYVTILETIRSIHGKPTPKGDSWSKILPQLDKWIDGSTDLGNIGSWTSNDVLVIDSLSRLSRAAFYFQLALGGHLGNMGERGGPEKSDYGNAQELIERLLFLLTSDQVPCHVIVICHIKYIERFGDKILRGMPKAIGSALSPHLAEYFNHALLAQSTGSGSTAKRRITTRTTGIIDLKTSAPLSVAPEYPLETGLAQYFQAVLGHGPHPEPSK